MTFFHILGFTWRDLVNRRVALNVVAGVLTFAIATAISALSIAFSSSATRVIDAAIEPTRTTAGVLEIRSRFGDFTVAEFARLREEIGKLERTGRIAAVSRVVTVIEDDVFTLLNEQGGTLGMQGIRIWSVPYDAPFLDPAYGATYLAGGPFENGPEIALSGDPGEFRPRLGVILNKSFVMDFLRIETDQQFDDMVADGHVDLKDIESIGIEMTVTAPDSRTRVETFDIELSVTAIVDEPNYADLIFTEDLARAFFFARSRFPGSYAARFDQWDSGQPLTRRSFADSQTSFFPRTAEAFDYVRLRDREEDNREPYGLLVLTLRDWRREGEREELQQALQLSIPAGEISGERAAQLVAWARRASSPSPLFGRPEEPRSVGRRNLTDLLLNEIRQAVPEFDLDDEDMQIEAVGTGTVNEFRVSDLSARASVEVVYDPAVDRVTFELTPPWRVDLLQARLTTALVRLQGVIDAYGIVMFSVVFVLAASAALLLALSHVLRKRRDIGLLLANGASRSTIFCIYIGQMVLMAAGGCILGVALSFLMAPFLESAAADTLRRFLASAAEEGVLESSSVLVLRDHVFYQAFLWVMLPALLGALYPVFGATRLDPLSSLGKGE